MKYNYFEKATIAVVNDFKQKFKNFAYVSNEAKWQEFPVFIQTSGDNAYMTIHSDKLEVKAKSDKILLPALALAFRGVTINEDNKTNEITDGKFTLELNGFSKEYVSEMTTYDLTLRMEGTLMCTDIFQYMAFIEYVMNGVYKNKPFEFSYMGKSQQGSWTLETVDHDVEMDEVNIFGSEEVSSHQETLSFMVNLHYPSFNLNDSLTKDVDGDGDGNSEGGIGVPNGAMASDNVIKSVIHYVDENIIQNPISKEDFGTNFPKEKQKNIENE